MPIKLQIRRGTASQWTSANPTLLAGEIGYETDTGNFKVGDNSTAWTSLAYQFPYATGTKALDTTTLVVDQTNDRIGIGTAAPTAKLHVNGGITFGGTSTASTMSMDGGNNVVHNAWNGHFFQTGGTTRARVEPAGNFSVGTFASAYGKIEANSAAPAVGIGLKTDLAAPDSANLYFKTDGTGYRMNVGSYSTATSSFTSAMTVTDAQRVGIGIAAPTEKLDVVGNIKASGNAAIGGNGTITGNLTLGSAQHATPTGTAPLFTCRAWVQFDGTRDTTGAVSTSNTNRLIRGSGNVSSVMRDATGRYTITFSTALADENYAWFSGADLNRTIVLQTGTRTTDLTSAALKIKNLDLNNLDADDEVISIAVIR